MFTGIVREVGRVASIGGGADGVRLEVDAPATARGARRRRLGLGRRVLPDRGRGRRRARSPSTPCPRRSRAPRSGGSRPASRVNVEPALRAGEPLGGHYVQGHVDGLGAVRAAEPEGDGRRVWFDVPAELLRYLVEKGSITVDGTSLTVAGLDGRGFAVALIPHTLEATTLGELAPGDPVNLETDVLAKYVERLLLETRR